MKLDNIKDFFLFNNMLTNIFDPLEDDQLSENYLAKENLYSRENRQKISDWIVDYKSKFINYIELKTEYKLKFNDNSLIALDNMLSKTNILNFIDNLETEYDIQKFLFEWVGYLGAYLFYYFKKKLRINPKIVYPIHNSYIKKDKKTIYPFILAMKKISIDETFSLYQYAGELITSFDDEDFKVDQEYIEEIEFELRPHLVKWMMVQSF